MRTSIATLFVLAFSVYALGWRQAPILEGDSPQYMRVAQDLEDFTLDSLHDRAPGYPVLLVLTGSSQTPRRTLFVVSLLLHIASIALLAMVLQGAHLPRSWILIFCAVLLLPPYVEPAGHVMTENLAQVLLAAAVSALVFGLQRPSTTLLVCAAVLIGAAALTRPTYQGLAFAIAALLLVISWIVPRAGVTRSLALKAGAILCAGTIVMVGSVSVSNYRKVGYLGVVPTAGIHLSTKTMAFVERLPDEYAAVREILVKERDAELTKRGGTHTGTQTIWSARDEIAAVTGLQGGDLSRFLLRMNLTLIRKAPMQYLEEVARSIATYWFPAAGGLATMHSTLLNWAWAGVHAAVILAFFSQLIVVTGAALFRASSRFVGHSRLNGLLVPAATEAQILAYLVSAAVVFYTMALSCFMDIGEVRQRRPTDVLIVLMVFLGAWIWSQSLRVATTEGEPARRSR